MYHYWLHREPTLGVVEFYLQADKVGIADCLSIAAPETVVDFRSVGGFDRNDTWMEHDIIYNKLERTAPLSPATQVYDLKTDPATVLREIEQLPLTIAQFAFECSDTLWMRGDSRYGQASIRIDFPLADESTWTERIGKQFPFLTARKDWATPDSVYYVMEGDNAKACFPGVSSLYDFQETDYLRILKSFNQYVD